MSAATGLRRRGLALATIALACAGGAGGYAWWSAQRGASAAATPLVLRPLAALPDPASGTRALVFRSTALGPSYGRVSLASPDGSAGERAFAALACERVHAAGGRGVCLQAERKVVTTYHAVLFDRALQPRQRFDLPGPPSRARMSPDGRRAAWTVFIAGHSYANTDFTTRTSIVDAESGTMMAEDLEAFTVTRDGAPFRRSDFNFWGVTFAADGNRFYATLGTGGEFLLVEADLAARTMRVLHAGIECPSLSPDGRRIAFKRREVAGGSGRLRWGLGLLDLASGAVTVLDKETRSVDDQVEWLDDGQLVYGLPDEDPAAGGAPNLWSIAVDGRSAPVLRLARAWSPAVLGR